MSEPGTTDPSAASKSADWESVARSAADDFGSVGSGEEDLELLRELLVFELDGAAYAVSVERVREIVRMKQLTRVPRTPAWMLGVVALRGEVVEVVDLRQRLGLGASTSNRSSRIIVLHGDVDRVTGLLVDSVSEVYRIHDEQVIPPHGLDVACVSEICPRGEEFVSILDVERALGVNDG